MRGGGARISGHVASAARMSIRSGSFSASRGIPEARFVASTKIHSSYARGASTVGYPYSAAPSSAGLRGSLPSNFRHRGFRGQLAVVPLLGGGYWYYPLDYGDYYPDSSNYVQQQPVPDDQTQQYAGPAYQGYDAPVPSTISPEPAAAAPVPDIGEFVFVKRDGGVLFASIFTVTGGQLRYVTPEGIRHTLPMSDIDASATEQMNEARGTTVQIHN